MDSSKKDDEDKKMPGDVSAFHDGAIERFLTSAIATILTLIFSWQIIMDMEKAERKRATLGNSAAAAQAAGQSGSGSEARARSKSLTENGFNDVTALGNGQKSRTEVKTKRSNSWEGFSTNSPSFDPFEDKIIPGEAEFISEMAKNDEFTFDEEIDLTPAKLPLIHVTPPALGAKRPLEPYQTYFGSDSDSDIECEHSYDANKLCPLDDFYIDYEDSSPSGSDSEVICRHVLEAITEEDEDEEEASSGESQEDSEEDTEPEDDYLECSRGDTSSSEDEYTLARGRAPTSPKESPKRAQLNTYDTTRARPNISTYVTQKSSINASSINNSSVIKEYNNCNTLIPGGPVETLKENIDLGQNGKEQHRQRGNIAQGKNSQESGNSGSGFGILSDLSFIDDNMNSDASKARQGRDWELRGPSDANESVSSNSFMSTDDIVRGVSRNTPGGTSDNNELLIDSGSTRTTSPPVYVDPARFVCEHSQGLNTILPSPSSKDHTGIISRSYYLDVKKPSMNRSRRGDAGPDAEYLSSSPPLRSDYGLPVCDSKDLNPYEDSELSDGTQDVPRGFTFVRTTEVEEDFKVTSTLLYPKESQDTGGSMDTTISTGSPYTSGSNDNIDTHKQKGELNWVETIETPKRTEPFAENLETEVLQAEQFAPVSSPPKQTFGDNFVEFTHDFKKQTTDSQKKNLEIVKFPSQSSSDSENDSSSTTTGDTAIEINPKLSVVRIGSIDSNGTDEDLGGGVLEEETPSAAKGSLEVKDVNEDEAVFVNLAETVHSPRFKSRRKFHTKHAKGDVGQKSDSSQNKARIRAPHHDNRDTNLKNAYNRSRNAPGSGSLRILEPSNRDNREEQSSSGDESGTNSDSSGSFDCESEKSPRGRPILKPPLQPLGEIEEEVSSGSSGEIEKVKTPDTSSTSSDSEYGDAEEKPSHRPNSPIQSVRDSIPLAQRSGPNTLNNSFPLEVKYGGDTIGPEETYRHEYINAAQDDSGSLQRPGVQHDYGNTSDKPVSKTLKSFENVSSSPKRAGDKTGLKYTAERSNDTPQNPSDPDCEAPQEIGMHSYHRHGSRQWTSPLLLYNPSKSEPPKPTFVESGAQTLRSYRQPNVCTFSPERYFRPCDVDATTFTITTEYNTGHVEEVEYAEKGIQITFDPLWDRAEALVPSQDELSNSPASSDEASNKSFENIDTDGFHKKETLELDVSVNIERNRSPTSIDHTNQGMEVGEALVEKSSSSSSNSEAEDRETGEKRCEKGITKAVDKIDLNVGNSDSEPEVFKAALDEQKVKVSPRDDSKSFQMEQSTQRPKTPPLFTKRNTPSMSVDIDFEGEEMITAVEEKGVEMAPPMATNKTKPDMNCSDADDEGESDSEVDTKPGNMYERFNKMRPKDEKKPGKGKGEIRPNTLAINPPKPEVNAKTELKPEPGRARSASSPKDAKVTTALNVTLTSKRPKSESDKEGLKKTYKSVLQDPVDVKPRNISHLITPPEKTMTVDRSDIIEAKQEYMKKESEIAKHNEEERKALLSKLLGTRDWSERPKPILKKPSASFREIDDSRREALARELSKSRESNMGVYSKEDVRERITAAVARQKEEDKFKFARTPLRATVGPIACSRYNEEMMKQKQNMTKSQTLPAGFGKKSTEISKSTDNILSGTMSLPRTFSAVLVRSPSMTLQKTPSTFFSDRKSYTNLLETDIDTGQVVEKPLVMETNLDEVLNLRKQTMPPKSRSLQDLYSHAGLKPVVKDVYTDAAESGKKWEKTQSLTALTSLSVYTEGTDVDQPEQELPTESRPRTVSDHEIRINKSLTKLDLPVWYKKSPPKPHEDTHSPKTSTFPRFSIGDSELRSTPSSANSSFSHASSRPVVIQTRVTMPRTSPVEAKPPTPVEDKNFELPSQRFRRNEETRSSLRPIRSKMESLELIRTKSREALVEKELKVAERKRVTAEFKLQKWEPPVIKSPERKRKDSENSEKRSDEERSPRMSEMEKDRAVQDLAAMLVTEDSPVDSSSPQVDMKFTSSTSISLNAAKPPPLPKPHDTSSDSELSFLNTRQAPSDLYDNPDRHFKPVHSSGSDPDSSFISQTSFNLNHALASSSPGPIQQKRASMVEAAPIEPAKPKLDLSSPPDDIESVSDVESPMPPPEIHTAVRITRPAPTIHRMETRVVAPPVLPQVQQPVRQPQVWQPSNQPQVQQPVYRAQVKPVLQAQVKQPVQQDTPKVKPVPPVRTSSKIASDMAQKKPSSSAMDRLKPQRPAPSRPEAKVVQPPVIKSEMKVTAPSLKKPVTKPPEPPTAQVNTSFTYQPSTSRGSESDTSITLERAPSYKVAPPVAPKVHNEAEVKVNQRSPPHAPKPKSKPTSPQHISKAVPVSKQRSPPAQPEQVREPKSPPHSTKQDPIRPMSLSHPVNVSIESQETPSFRLARAPGSRTSSFRDSSSYDPQGPSSPRSPTQYSSPEGPSSPRSSTGSYREVNDYRGPASPKSPNYQEPQRYQTPPGYDSPQTPGYTEYKPDPNWKLPANFKRRFQGPVVPAPRATMETDSDLSYANSPDQLSPVKKQTPRKWGSIETDLDNVQIRRLPAKQVLETDIDGDLFDSPIRKKGISRSPVLETNIDDDIRASRGPSDYRTPSLPPRRGHRNEPVRDYGPPPNIPPRLDKIPKFEASLDYGPAPDLPPRRAQGRRQEPMETDIDGDVSFTSSQPSVVSLGRSPQIQQSQPRYDNVPGYKAQVGYSTQSNKENTPYNQEPQYSNARNTRNSQPLYYSNMKDQQNNYFKAPPIPPRDTSKDVPPPTIHKTDGLFETDLDFNQHNFETVAVEGDVNSTTPHGTLTRFGRKNPPNSNQNNNQVYASTGPSKSFDYEFEPPSNSIAPTPLTVSGATYATSVPRGQTHEHHKHSPPRQNIPMETEQDMLFAFVVNKQPRENGAISDDVSMTSPIRSAPGTLEFGPDSFQVAGRRSDLKVDTNSFRFSREEERLKCEVGFSGKSEHEASLAEVLDGLLALPPSPVGNYPGDSGNNNMSSADRADYANGVFGTISESGENILSLTGKQNIDENKVKVKCRNTKCGKEMALSQARGSYKTCYNCYTYYCCRHCRRHDWSLHKTICSYNRVTSMCKRAIKKIYQDQRLLHQVSKIARAGYLASGRGCVLFVFQTLLEAEQFVKQGLSTVRLEPIYCSMTELEEYYVLGEYGDTVMDMCVDYSPYLKFIANIAIVMGKEQHTNSGPHREGPVIKKCAKLSLSPGLSEAEPETAVSHGGALVLTVGHRNSSTSYLTPQEARDESFDEIQRKLRQRGVCLREQYPDVFNQLVAYVNENQTFSPITIYPYDGSTGNTFMCIIKPEPEDEMEPADVQITFDSFT